MMAYPPGVQSPLVFRPLDRPQVFSALPVPDRRRPEERWAIGGPWFIAPIYQVGGAFDYPMITADHVHGKRPTVGGHPADAKHRFLKRFSLVDDRIQGRVIRIHHAESATTESNARRLCNIRVTGNSKLHLRSVHRQRLQTEKIEVKRV